MATSTTSPTSSSSSMEPLPFDIILTIVYLALSSHPAYNTMLQFSLVSRTVYQRMLPRLYHTLDLERYNIDSPSSTKKKIKKKHVTPPSSHAIDRTRLLDSAKSSSFLFTCRIISQLSDVPFTFSHFPFLTHLSLYDRNCLDLEPNGPLQAREIVMLPLEEALALEPSDNYFLLRELNPDVTVWRTLQRFGCYSDPRCSRPDEGWLRRPNLAHVLVRCDSIDWFIDSLMEGVTLPSSPKFQSYIVSPSVGSSMLPPEDYLTHPVKDPRFTILCKAPKHFKEPPRLFWDNQSAMWAVAQDMIQKKLDAKGIRVINKLPWSKDKGCYIVS
ncbi:hypothetical protein DL96DRAFT_1627096 [Flagelloscypha sp. PMI_526]|nr:hypothetical protein DL96DRAFT_1627096 [Flagelloscypha sp. PMI_526]